MEVRRPNKRERRDRNTIGLLTRRRGITFLFFFPNYNVRNVCCSRPIRQKFAFRQIEIMSYDEIIPLLGDFGRYQKRIYFLLCLPAILCAFHKLGTVFLVADPDYRWSPFAGRKRWIKHNVKNYLLGVCCPVSRRTPRLFSPMRPWKPWYPGISGTTNYHLVNTSMEMRQNLVRGTFLTTQFMDTLLWLR